MGEGNEWCGIVVCEADGGEGLEGSGMRYSNAVVVRGDRDGEVEEGGRVGRWKKEGVA